MIRSALRSTSLLRSVRGLKRFGSDSLDTSFSRATPLNQYKHNFFTTLCFIKDTNCADKFALLHEYTEATSGTKSQDRHYPPGLSKRHRELKNIIDVKALQQSIAFYTSAGIFVSIYHYEIFHPAVFVAAGLGTIGSHCLTKINYFVEVYNKNKQVKKYLEEEFNKQKMKSY